MKQGDLQKAREEMQEFFRSFMLYEYPILDPNSRYHVIFQQLLEILVRIGDRLKQQFPEKLVSLGLRGSYSHGHPYEGDDVDVLFIGEGLTSEIEEVTLRITREELEPNGFELCHGKAEMGLQLQPVSFLDLKKDETILKSYMYGLAAMLYREADENTLVTDPPLAQRKSRLLQSGILVPYLLWVYGLENVSRVFGLISQYLPIPQKEGCTPAYS